MSAEYKAEMFLKIKNLTRVRRAKIPLYYLVL